jgi:thymidylate synthase (FAD)
VPKVLNATFVIEQMDDGAEILRRVERYGRTCYKSECKMSDGSAPEFIRKILKMGHESVIEHEAVTVRIICDRGVSHEIVRHRIASYSQESTRYVDYGKAGEINVIDITAFMSPEQLEVWRTAMNAAEDAYNLLRKMGASPQIARSVLPNSTKTEIVVTYNLREWRHFFRLRTAPGAHPQMREIAVPLCREFKQRIPVVFDDIALPEVASA